MTKAVLAILWAICWGAIGLSLIVENKINTKVFVGVISFALIGAIAIYNVDRLIRVKGGGIDLEMAQQQVDTYVNEGIHKIEKEISVQKDSINLLIGVAQTQDEKLKKTISEVNAQQDSIQQIIQAAADQEKRLRETTEMAAPPRLSFVSPQIYKEESIYIASIAITSSKNQSLGEIVLEVEVIDGSNTKIIDFSPITASANMRKRILLDGKKSSLIFTPLSPRPLGVQIKTSDVCKVKVSGNHDLESIILEIRI